MIRVLLTEQTPGSAAGMRAMLAQCGDVRVVGYPRDGLEAAQMAARLQPDVLLVHDQLPEMSGGLACELAALASPGVACALLCDRSDTTTLRRAMRAGARAVVTPDTTPEQLGVLVDDLAAVARQRNQREFALVTDPAAMPVTIAFAAGRDGVGKSTLAVNVATALAGQFPGRVALVDFCGQFGSAALLLNLRPSHTLIDLVGFAPEVDLDLIETCMERHASGLKVLAGGMRPDPSWQDALAPGLVAMVLGLLRRRYSYVICDLPTLVCPGTLYAISRAQECVLVTGLSDITGLRETAGLTNLLVPEYIASEQLKLVVNRTSERDSFREDDVRAAAGREVWHSVPNDATNVFAAANDGVPVTSAKPACAFAKSVTALASKLVEATRAQH